jgi:hypothetical protein
MARPGNPAQIEAARRFVNLSAVASIVAERQPIRHPVVHSGTLQRGKGPMLRILLLLIALLILIAIGLVATGVINLSRSDNGGVTIQTRDVEVGTTEANVQLPVVRMENRTVEMPSIGVEDSNQQVNAQ